MNFHCKYCGKYSILTTTLASNDSFKINNSSSEHGQISLRVATFSCPNPLCKKLHLSVDLFKYDKSQWDSGKKRTIYENKKEVETWNLLPRSRARPLPDYVPQEIRSSYEEACLIWNDSPKASAAMSRRCLQGIVRDFWNIPVAKRGNLGAEISYIKEKIDPDTLDSIKAVREVGDIGAHMEKSVDTIVDVEPGEAELLIELIETLIEDWYVGRQKREDRNSRLKSMAGEKRELKKRSKQISE